jgi:TetR/AcrR family transcriptional regulator of autoinduction and epiphytic fitness
VLETFLAGAVSLKHIEYDRNKSLGEQLLDFADAEIALIANPQWLNFMKVLLSRLINDNEFAKESHAKYSAHHKDLEIWIAAAMKDGRLSATDPGLAAYLFSAMVNGAFTFPALYQRTRGEEAVRVLKKEIIETFLQRYAVNQNRDK